MNVRGTKFYILDSKFVGFYTAVGFYLGHNRRFGFAIHVDVDDDQLLYEFLEFIRVFAVGKESNMRFNLDQDTKEVTLHSRLLPSQTYLRSFAGSFLSTTLTNLVLQEANNLLEDQYPHLLQSNFVIKDNVVYGAEGSYLLNQPV